MKGGWEISNSNWRREVLAVFRKEYRSEIRSQSGLMTAGLFSVMAVFAVSVAGFNVRLGGGIASGLLWLALLFAAILSGPRRFTQEEEMRTADQLRLWGRPHAIYWGKALFAFAELLLTATVLCGLFFLLTSAKLAHPGLFVLGMAGSLLALSGAVCVCGAIAAPASNRTALAATLALPLLAPVIFWGVAALRVSLGEGVFENGMAAAWGLLGYGIASVAIGPYLFASVWKP